MYGNSIPESAHYKSFEADDAEGFIQLDHVIQGGPGRTSTSSSIRTPKPAGALFFLSTLEKMVQSPSCRRLR
jgi:hypothetical protein